MNYYTVKYNNGSSHRLDEYNTLALAVAAAKTLHHPDWPCGQGIRVKDAHTHETIFDTGK